MDDPEAKTFQNGLDDILIFNDVDDPHFPSVFRANQWIGPIDFLNQPGLAFPVCCWGAVGFHDVRDDVITGFILPFPPGDVAVIIVIPDHLLPPFRSSGWRPRIMRITVSETC